MQSTVRRLILIHVVVLLLSATVFAFVSGFLGSLAAFVGALSFSLPVVIFSILVLNASKKDPQRFWGRFMAAEVFKWVFAGFFLFLAFAFGHLQPIPLLAGFFLSVLIQVIFPILVKRESAS